MENSKKFCYEIKKKIVTQILYNFILTF